MHSRLYYPEESTVPSRFCTDSAFCTFAGRKVKKSLIGYFMLMLVLMLMLMLIICSPCLYFILQLIILMLHPNYPTCVLCGAVGGLVHSGLIAVRAGCCDALFKLVYLQDGISCFCILRTYRLPLFDPVLLLPSTLEAKQLELGSNVSWNERTISAHTHQGPPYHTIHAQMKITGITGITGIVPCRHSRAWYHWHGIDK